MLTSLVRPAVRCMVRSRRPLGHHQSLLLRGCSSVKKWGKINDSIEANVVNIVQDCGSLRANVPIHQAIQEAQSQGLDLVQVSPLGKMPTVCKIFDTNKRLYELKKASKNMMKQQKVKVDKEVLIGAKIAPNDLSMKVDQLKRFLSKGHKVKVTIKYAQAYHLKDQCLEQLKRIDSFIDAETGVLIGPPKDQYGGVYVNYSPVT
ncbi:translation initiation factor if-3 [Plasmopara halstedii]|uniref:Translation initiation factor if-3 n=1 Tax=Plasmopara halstedii TaxID=4781 RepID=A0A0P1AZY3_PLAHL|nr:translation initiation factor if-3 [Plasmopara halstedii]CEG47036.1 translation initiation factor if-3 [Plasmopara halstedii]|eukprot:XP_024583405.1 translation initiation factor if-3 [Plasmopara halstedii]